VLGFFEFSQRPFPVALLGVGIPQVSVNARIGWIELLRLVPKGNGIIQLALLFGAFAQAQEGVGFIRVEPQRFAQFLLCARKVPLEHQREAQYVAQARAVGF
jgi:hypothetical protein